MDLRTYAQIVRRRWWLLLLGPLLAAGIAFAISKQMTPIYTTSSTLLVNQTQNPGVVQYNDILTSERLTNTYAQLIERQPVLAEVTRLLSLPMTEDGLADKISVATVRNTQLLRITVEDPDPQLASMIANSTAQAFIDDNSRSLGRPGTVTIAEEARVPKSPSKPDTRLNTMLAGMLGLMVVGGIALLLEYLDDTIKASEETEPAIGLPTLGTVQRMKRVKGTAVALLEPGWSDAYLQLRTNIHFAGVGTRLKSILVTSCSPGEGKSTTASGLAAVLAQAGERVILVDTDLRRPTLHTVFGLPNSFGLTGLLLSDAYDPAPALVESGLKNLQVLPSGPLPANPADLLMSDNMARIITNLQQRADYVIFDSPPVLAVTDASILASRTDGTILVAEAGSTRTHSVVHAIQDLSKSQARLVGLVVNKARTHRAGYYGNYHYGYGKAKALDMDNSSRITKPKQVA
ncbi:MAG: polysaccharide biosynthesis tyrosine autokinase [Dehalococcoidia bacterium]|nr:polysaccharide biosynthesis tyrosine autokinase [Dehalococcoidia bacterium]